MKKPNHSRLDPAVYVVLHARWRLSRSRKPSAGYHSERNPRKALQEATNDCAISPDGTGVIQRDVEFFTPDQIRAALNK
ncbi:MAG: hypothetical protein KBC33_01545 [Candidatus Pacebacteria bacterium]|nr:hypothetical protein [Candidatus Paceibacterota bacterium]